MPAMLAVIMISRIVLPRRLGYHANTQITKHRKPAHESYDDTDTRRHNELFGASCIT
jgi:hypothetical protein